MLLVLVFNFFTSKKGQIPFPLDLMLNTQIQNRLFGTDCVFNFESQFNSKSKYL